MGSPGSSDLISLPSAAAHVDSAPSGLPHTVTIVTIRAPPCGSGHTIGPCNGSADSTPASSTSKPPPSRCMSARFWSSTPSTMPGGYTFDRLRDELALRIKAMPRVPREARRQPVQSGPSGVGGRQRLRRESASAPDRSAATGRARRTGRDLRSYRVLAAGPQPAAVGDVGHRGRRGHRCARRAVGWR